MEYDRPKVDYVYHIGEGGLKAVPAHLDATKISEREEFYIYNPFDPGLSVKMFQAGSLTYALLATGILVDTPEMVEKLGRGHDSLERQQNIAIMAENFWPVAAATFNRLLKMPKRDNGIHPNISPDMGLTVAPPKRKIDGPKNTRKPGPPTPGGR